MPIDIEQTVLNAVRARLRAGPIYADTIKDSPREIDTSRPEWPIDDKRATSTASSDYPNVAVRVSGGTNGGALALLALPSADLDPLIADTVEVTIRAAFFMKSDAEIRPLVGEIGLALKGGDGLLGLPTLVKRVRYRKPEIYSPVAGVTTVTFTVTVETEAYLSELTQ